MCGIAGFVSRDAGRPVDPRVVEKMRDRLKHRGPDAFGLYANGRVALGHRRLSIIDLEGGVQPMFSSDERKVIVFNGEIYNYRELRGELQNRGHSFRTDSDTEVVLAAYEEYGTDFATHLNGMFAIALWDEARSRLVLVRDRLGIKPLFVGETSEGLAFGSEIKALLELPGVDQSWDLQSIHDYFHFMYVPGPRTIYRGIRQVQPGTMIVVESGSARSHTYWRLEPAGGAPDADDFMQLLAESVGMQMVADVPIGCFLSGGIDSGLIAAFMSARTTDPIRTFTVYDPNVPVYDERERAALVAGRYRTRHLELIGSTDVDEAVRFILESFDEPFADSGSVPNFVVCEQGRKQVKVALSGLGGDELAGGYVRYLGMQLKDRIPFASGRFARWLARAADLIPEGRGLASDRIKRFTRLLGLSESEAYTRAVSGGGLLKRAVLSADLLKAVDRSSPHDRIFARLKEAGDLGCDPVNRLLYTDLLTYVPDDLLTLADRTSMRSSLEVRVPFLDHRLVSRALSIPGSEKIRGSELKAFLRRASKEWLPESVIHGPKRGFSAPMADWLRGPLRSEMQRAIETTAPATGLLDRSGLREAWEAHVGGRANHETILWATLLFARWAESR